MKATGSVSSSLKALSLPASSGISETFTVRRVSYGVGVERVFPMHSPNVKAVQVVRQGRVRRAKLYYLRNRVGKAAKVKEQLK